jgi:hypothetical protein
MRTVRRTPANAIRACSSLFLEDEQISFIYFDRVVECETVSGVRTESLFELLLGNILRDARDFVLRDRAGCGDFSLERTKGDDRQ